MQIYGWVLHGAFSSNFEKVEVKIDFVDQFFKNLGVVRNQDSASGCESSPCGHQRPFPARILLDAFLTLGKRFLELPMDPNIQGSFLFNNSLNQFPSDLKAPVCQYSVPNSFYKLNPGLNTQLQPGTPHGISDILSRSMLGVGSTSTTLLSGYSPMGGFGPSVTSTSMYYNRDYNPSLGFSKSATECPIKARSVSCWAEGSCDWRGGRQQCTSGSGPLGEMPNRKKHTRPTFSGHQIFALEKTFEQTKYLAGPERARLAYSLGMTESQVKVWFQNRRTKWRKKSASEPSSTQASHAGQGGEASENEVEDEEYNKPLDPDSDDDKIRLLLRKHRRAFSVLRQGPHPV